MRNPINSARGKWAGLSPLFRLYAVFSPYVLLSIVAGALFGAGVVMWLFKVDINLWMTMVLFVASSVLFSLSLFLGRALDKALNEAMDEVEAISKKTAWSEGRLTERLCADIRRAWLS